MTQMHTVCLIEPGIIAFSEREPFVQPNSCYADRHDMRNAQPADGGFLLRDRDAQEPHDVLVPAALFHQGLELL